jgi:hypothetical protein
LTLYDDVTAGANIERLRHVFLRQLKGLLMPLVDVLTASFDPDAPTGASLYGPSKLPIQ